MTKKKLTEVDLDQIVRTRSVRRKMGILKKLYVYNRPSKDVNLHIEPAFSGENYTDGNKIHLSFFPKEEEKKLSVIIALLEAKLGHEAAHVNYTSFKSFLELQKEEGPEIASVFNIVEDGRIENFISSKFKGLKNKLRFLNIFLFAEEIGEEPDEDAKNRLFNNALFYSKLGDYQEGYKESKEPDAVAFREKIVPLIDEAVVEVDNAKFKEIVRAIWKEMIPFFAFEKPGNNTGNGGSAGEGDGQGSPQSFNDLSEKEKEAVRKLIEELIKEGKLKTEPQSKGQYGGMIDIPFDGEIDPENSPRNNGEKKEESEESKGSKESEKSEESKESGKKDEKDDSESSEDAEGSEENSEEKSKEESKKGSKKASSKFNPSNSVPPTHNYEKEEEELEKSEAVDTKNIEDDIKKIKELEERQAEEKRETTRKSVKEVKEIEKKLQRDNTGYDMSRQMASISISYFTDTESILPQYKSHARKLKNKMEQIFKSKQDYTVNMQERGILDINNLAKSQIHNNIFKVMGSPDDRDYVVDILLDNSGSMSSQNKYYHATAGTMILEEALKDLVSLRIIGYTTNWEHGGSLQVNEFKDFEDRYQGSRLSHTLKHNSGLLAYQGNLEDLNMIYESNLLEKRPEKEKIMFLITDGLPNYGRESVKILREVQKLLKKKQITFIPIFIGSESAIEDIKDDFKELYPENSFLTSPEDLEKNISTLLSRLFKR